MSGYVCSICGGPVDRTPTGIARKHCQWRVGADGPYQTTALCPGRGAQRVPAEERDMSALVAEVVAERFGAPGRRQ